GSRAPAHRSHGHRRSRQCRRDRVGSACTRHRRRHHRRNRLMSDDTQPGMIDRRPVHKGRIVDLSIDTVRFPDGSTGELEFIRHSGAAAVLPVLGDPAGPDPQVLLIRQYRYASGGFMLEVPAGRPDREGEDWEVCARRELEEETGLVAGSLTYMTMIHTTPGFT